MSSGGWHNAESHSRSLPPSGGGSGSGSGVPEEDEDQGGYNPDFDAFLADEAALPGSETKTKDAVIFLIDCSASMQFPMDQTSLQDMADSGRIKVKPEGGSGGSWDSGGGGFDSSGGAAAASGSGSRSSGGAAAAAAADGSELEPCSQLQMVLRVLFHAVRQKIICSPDDYVGVCFFGTRETQNGNNFSHIYVHTPLQQLTAAGIRRLDQLADESEFDQLIGHLSEADVAKGKVEMDKILWICSTMFQDV